MFYRLTLHTPLSPSQVAARLDALRRPLRRGLRAQLGAFLAPAPDPKQPLLGRVDEHGFTLRRELAYHNAFQPRMHGWIHPGPGGNGAKLDVLMLMRLPALLFMLLWITIASWSTVQWASGAGVHGERYGMAAAGLAVAGGLMLGVGFVPELRRGRALLVEALRARERGDGPARTS